MDKFTYMDTFNSSDANSEDVFVWMLNKETGQSHIEPMKRADALELQLDWEKQVNEDIKKFNRKAGLVLALGTAAYFAHTYIASKDGYGKAKEFIKGKFKKLKSKFSKEKAE